MTPFPIRTLEWLRGREADALVGDLMEERRKGRSAFWLWKQVGAAIVTGMGRDVIIHRRLLPRVIVVLAFVVVPVSIWFAVLPRDLSLWWTYRELTLLPSDGAFALTAVIGLFQGFIAGWIVGRVTGPLRGLAVSLAFLLVLGFFTATTFAASDRFSFGRPGFDLNSLGVRFVTTELTFAALFLAGLVLGGVLSARHRNTRVGEFA